MSAHDARATPATARAVLRFWFGDEDDAVRADWFRQRDDFDREIDQRFGAEIEAALRGRLQDWDADRDARLALVLLLDQFTRNVFRGTPRAFAGDALARAVARRMIDAGQDRELPPLRRWFVYMPFEHAEDLALQDEAVRLFGALCQEASPHAQSLAGALDYAERHRAVIRRFGRFPHRNAVLGRASTAEESAFLLEPGSRF